MASGCLAVMGQASVSDASDDASDDASGGGGSGGGGELLYWSLGEVAWRTGAPLKDGEGEEEAGGEAGAEEEGLSLFPSGLCEEDALAMSRSRSRAGRLPLSHRRPAARTPVFKRKQPWAAWRRRGPSAWWWRSKLLGPRLL